MKTFICLMAAVIAVSGAVRAGSAEEGSVSLTVYNNDFAVVRENRPLIFEKGVNTVRFTGVASAIEPASVGFKCLEDPGAVSVLEQNYEYDLVGSESLLNRYIDREVEVALKGSGADFGRRVRGVLMAAPGSELILQEPSGSLGIYHRNIVEEIRLDQIPEGLVTRPTLVWLAEAARAGEYLCRITYLTGGISWAADYSAVLSDDEKGVDFGGWVTIENNSGIGYDQASIKLIAGDVRRLVPPGPIVREMAMAADARSGAFEEKAFMEYHMYTLGRKSTINNRQVKQIEFISPVQAVPMDKVYIYDRAVRREKVQVKIEFVNSKKGGLGMPLPKGKVRVFKTDPADETVEFVGEDAIDHTAAGEKIRLYIGDAFDITPEYTAIDSRHDRRSRTDTHQVQLRNAKPEAVVVFVDDKFGGSVNWVIDESTHPYEKTDSLTARFTVEVGAGSEATLKYTVSQNW